MVSFENCIDIEIKFFFKR